MSLPILVSVSVLPSFELVPIAPIYPSVFLAAQVCSYKWVLERDHFVTGGLVLEAVSYVLGFYILI